TARCARTPCAASARRATESTTRSTRSSWGSWRRASWAAVASAGLASAEPSISARFETNGPEQDRALTSHVVGMALEADPLDGRGLILEQPPVVEDEPTPIKWVGFESHSDDVRSQSSVLFGSV